MVRIISRVILLCLLVSLVLSSEGLYTAIALEVEGDVAFLDGDVWEEVFVDMPFRDGEQIKTGEDAYLLLLYRDGQIAGIDSDTEYTVSLVGDPGDEPHYLWTMTEERLLQLYSIETEMQNNELRGKNLIVRPGMIVAPKNTKIARVNTRFHWTIDDDTEKSQIRFLKDISEIKE